jgi:hypothetical protein
MGALVVAVGAAISGQAWAEILAHLSHVQHDLATDAAPDLRPSPGSQTPLPMSCRGSRVSWGTSIPAIPAANDRLRPARPRQPGGLRSSHLLPHWPGEAAHRPALPAGCAPWATPGRAQNGSPPPGRRCSCRGSPRAAKIAMSLTHDARMLVVYPCSYGGGARRQPRTYRQRSLPDSRAGGVFQECPAGCCPHPQDQRASSPGTTLPACPPDIPGWPLPERVAHLYACQELSTYRIAGQVGISRQRVTRMLHHAGVAVKPQGAGRRRGSGGGQYPAEFLAVLYQRLRLNCAEISAVTGIPARTIRDRLVASGVRMRTRGGVNREDRTALDPDRLAALYVRAGLCPWP